MLKSLCLTAALAVVASAAAAQTVDPNSDLGQFRTLRAAGMDALDKGDVATAKDQFDKAAALMPDSPSILLLKAQLDLQGHDTAAAHDDLADYLGRGYVVDLGKNPDFNQVWDGALDDQQNLNQQAIGDMHVATSLPGFSLTDAIAYAPDSSQIFAAGIHDGKIVAVSPQGSRDVMTFRPGVAAYGLGLRDGVIWATTAASRQTQGYDPARTIASKIVTIDPANGQVTASFTDASQPDRRFGHLLMGKDDLYVADATHGEILRLNGYAGEPQVLVPEGYMDSPSGLAENADASALMVSDFVSGLYRVDLAGGTMARLSAPDGGSLLGISSLARYGDDLIAIENGFKPAKILRLHMSPDWLTVQSVEVLLRSDKLLSQPSQGLVDGDHFIFVARSQWDNMDDQGNPVSDKPDPAVIGAIKLDPGAAQPDSQDSESTPSTQP